MNFVTIQLREWIVRLIIIIIMYYLQLANIFTVNIVFHNDIVEGR